MSASDYGYIHEDEAVEYVLENCFDQVEEAVLENRLDITRIWAMPNKNTFTIKPIKKLMEQETNIKQLGVDSFAGDNGWIYSKFTNDLNPKKKALVHLEATEFLKGFMDNIVDYAIYDPPFSPRQLKECYDNIDKKMGSETYRMSTWASWKNEIARIVKPNGKVISFGWCSGGMGKKRGFTLQRILLVPHGSEHNDTICTVETKNEV